MHSNIFFELSIVVGLAAAVSAVMKLLRQPMIIGYIFTGLLLGPYALNAVDNPAELRGLAQFGIALLLFIIGLGLNPRVVKEVGRAAAYIGTAQVLFTAAVGFGVAQAMGFSTTASLFLAIGLTFSSTIIVLKLLSDKKEVGQLYGKVATGILLVQDILATIVLIITAGVQDGNLPLPELGVTFLTAIVLIGGLILLGLFVLPHIKNFIADNQEFLFLFALAWGFGVASIFAKLNLSIEVGALFAGVALAAQPYAAEISSRLRPLRDFFVVLFFILLGIELEISQLSSIIGPALALSGFVLIGNPLIVMSTMGLLGYTKKTSFKTALTMAQVSEFSLIFVILGRELGLINQQIVSIVTLVGIITIAASTYLMLYDDQLYHRLEKYLGFFEREKIKHQPKTIHDNHDIILFGFDRAGHEFVNEFKRLGKRFLVVDYNPEAIEQLRSLEVPHAYGDITDVEFLQEINVESARMIISTVTNRDVNLFLSQHISDLNHRATIITQAEKPDDAELLYDSGSTYVMMPHYIGSERIINMMHRAGGKKSYYKPAREKHLAYLARHL